jgi:hypothetical protein
LSKTVKTMRTLPLCCSALLLLTSQSCFQQAYSQPAPPPVSAFSAPTVNDYLQACRIDQSACVDEVGSAMMDKFEYAGDLCLTSVDYANAVPGWLSAHAETHSMPTEDGIYLALKSLYRCD